MNKGQALYDALTKLWSELKLEVEGKDYDTESGTRYRYIKKYWPELLEDPIFIEIFFVDGSYYGSFILGDDLNKKLIIKLLGILVNSANHNIVDIDDVKDFVFALPDEYKFDVVPELLQLNKPYLASSLLDTFHPDPEEINNRRNYNHFYVIAAAISGNYELFQAIISKFRLDNEFIEIAIPLYLGCAYNKSSLYFLEDIIQRVEHRFREKLLVQLAVAITRIPETVTIAKDVFDMIAVTFGGSTLIEKFYTYMELNYQHDLALMMAAIEIIFRSGRYSYQQLVEILTTNYPSQAVTEWVSQTDV